MHVTMVHVRIKPDTVEAFIEACRLNHQGSTAEPGNRRNCQSADAHVEKCSDQGTTHEHCRYIDRLRSSQGCVPAGDVRRQNQAGCQHP